ncbi:M20/M25/M40 family metallo-hydrolase [Nocardia sp. NPDC050793]|uniref:M20/M25/M40 family metallo-hydrolase n=1 Tax=Nocardia sp. NPDC050793 TaxID=3155159 RepID=UPI0033CBEAF1
MKPYRPLYVVKIGNRSIRASLVWSQIKDLVDDGAHVLVVAGGSADLTEHYAAMHREPPVLTMENGTSVRDSRHAEIPHIVDSYRTRTLPRLVRAAEQFSLRATVRSAGADGLVRGVRNRPIKALFGDRVTVVRDLMVGQVAAVDTVRVRELLASCDVLCLTPPIADPDGGWLNIDADVLAAQLSNELSADHLRIVTSTPGLLADPEDARTRLPDLYRGEGYAYASGRMRQKVRAVELADSGTADIAITGPDTLDTTLGTRYWRVGRCAPELDLLSKMVDISSVSGDERELAIFLRDWATARGLSADLDKAGNLVVSVGEGSFTVLLLGHLDTVRHRWRPHWRDGALTGRGSVDAKGCLATFLETAASIPVPPGARLVVVGAVEEETTSRGAFHIRDNYTADAVVIGEPSGEAGLTIGYNGLLKVRLDFGTDGMHPAGEGSVTGADGIIAEVVALRQAVAAFAPHALVATLDVGADEHGGRQVGYAVVDIRVPADVELAGLVAVIEARSSENLTVDVLRATPGVITRRDTDLVRSFAVAFRSAGLRPRYVFKRGSSDMNTLATAWSDVAMVAYGPGDANYDHTPDEQITAAAYETARGVLASALTRLLDRGADR